MNQDSNLPADHYRLYLDAKLPSEEALFTAFQSVSALFAPEQEWTTPAQWPDATMPGERVFFVKQFETPMTFHGIRAWAAENGYRPATHLEAIRFGAVHPETVRDGEASAGVAWIAALGSTTADGGHPQAAVLMYFGNTLRLDAMEAVDRSFPLAKEGRYLLVQLAA